MKIRKWERKKVKKQEWMKIWKYWIRMNEKIEIKMNEL